MNFSRIETINEQLNVMNKAFESTEVKFVTKEINRVNKPDYFHNVAPYK